MMWAGLLWSRSLLSLSLVAFLLLSLFSFPIKTQVRYIQAHPFLWIPPLFFLPPMISGLWSEDLGYWLRTLQIKAPLLLVPLLALPLARISRPQLRVLVYVILACLLADLGKSLSYFIQHYDTVVQDYLRAKVLPVGMKNDHVRYGWMLTMVWTTGLWMLQQPFMASATADRNRLKVFLVVIFVFQHLLASKTGLLGTYLAGLIWLIMEGKKSLGRWAVLLLFTPLLAWAILPTFRHRLQFVRWDFQHYSRGQYTEGLSDGPRISSLQAGLETWKTDPLKGTGFGDIRREITAWYSRNLPDMKTYEHLLPSNEFLLYGASSGWPGFLLALMGAFLPFFLPARRKQFPWICFHVLAVTGFMYEIALETQYGVFLYAFSGTWLYVVLTAPEYPVEC